MRRPQLPDEACGGGRIEHVELIPGGRVDVEAARDERRKRLASDEARCAGDEDARQRWKSA
jgi:hypothetical protein